ncbi:hypothetical protein CYMTET_19311 [Cymbomonas tetramitiformis]|uniref:Uncharacterized protein n=1 Tax=Cymbomonas tetramitiformis TaxID=36881 RepID=A0AAE0G6C7_9CHLO|nr:hypothetical protein CYMTET_19311 [Cymbomonas tetramitiformis]
MQEGQETQKEEDGTMQEMAEQHDLEATGETAEPQEPHAADEAQEDFMEALNATAQEQEGEEAARERGRNRNIDRAGSCPKTLLLAADGFGCGGVGENVRDLPADAAAAGAPHGISATYLIECRTGSGKW